MSKSKKQETPHFIMDFVKEISDSPDLYLSCFNEKTALTDATRIMREQKTELATLRRELAVQKRALEMAMQHDRFGGDCPADYEDGIEELCNCSTECDSDGSACWGKWFTAQATAELEANRP